MSGLPWMKKEPREKGRGKLEKIEAEELAPSPGFCHVEHIH